MSDAVVILSCVVLVREGVSKKEVGTIGLMNVEEELYVGVDIPELMASHEGGIEVSFIFSKVPGRKGDGEASRCSIKLTWKELKTRFEEGIQRRYDLEWGEYPMSLHSVDRCSTLGLFVRVRANALHPISCK